MINIIWQTKKDNTSVLGDETNGQFQYINNVIFKNIEHINHFDNKEYKTVINNSIIVYSAPDKEIDNGLNLYLRKYKSLNFKYILLHLSNEILNHNCDYYDDSEHVFRFYYDQNIKKTNVTTLPLGFVSGYMNTTNNINLSEKRDILVTFIGQVKSDRHLLINSISNIQNKFLHITNKWNCPTCLSSNEVIEIYKKTLFIPCPMGWCNPDSLRIFEALEWGCIPIIKKYDGIDYFKYIFGEHPLPLINDWSEITELINKLTHENLDDLILSINSWYINLMDSMSVNVANIVNEKLKNNK